MTALEIATGSEFAEKFPVLYVGFAFLTECVTLHVQSRPAFVVPYAIKF